MQKKYFERYGNHQNSCTNAEKWLQLEDNNFPRMFNFTKPTKSILKRWICILCFNISFSSNQQVLFELQHFLYESISNGPDFIHKNIIRDGFYDEN